MVHGMCVFFNQMNIVRVHGAKSIEQNIITTVH